MYHGRIELGQYKHNFSIRFWSPDGSPQICLAELSTNKTDENLSDEFYLYLRASVSRFNENPLEV